MPGPQGRSNFTDAEVDAQGAPAWWMPIPNSRGMIFGRAGRAARTLHHLVFILKPYVHVPTLVGTS